MSTAPNLDVVEAGLADYPAIEKGMNAEKPANFKGDLIAVDSDLDNEAPAGPNGEQYPTSEQVETLRRVCGKIPWLIYTIAFVEMCERFAYYGTTGAPPAINRD